MSSDILTNEWTSGVARGSHLLAILHKNAITHNLIINKKVFAIEVNSVVY